MHSADLLLITLLALTLPGVHGGKVLVFPVDGSHWVNMRILVEELHSRGHSVTVVRAAASWYIKEKSPHYTAITVHGAGGHNEEFFISLVSRLLQIQREGRSAWTRFSLDMELKERFSEMHKNTSEMVSQMLEDQELMQSLRDTEYDLVLADPAAGDEIAAAFAQLPQKVIWRYTGDRPTTLGNNTRLVSWMPQNDLLGHPKTRVFVSHGGTNGIYEAIYHGVPILGLPLIFDQHDNLQRMKAKGAAKVVDIATLDRHIFLQTLQEVLHDPSYRMNMQRLSRLHRDQPMKPLDRALFWIEFVMRNKGAAHLRTESYRMPWYSYHSVDVIGVLLAAVLLIILIIIAVISPQTHREAPGGEKQRQDKMKPNTLWSIPIVLFMAPLMFIGSLCHGGKVLVFPLEGSHWVNMEVLIKAIHARGHMLTVVRTDKSWYIKEKSPYYTSITVPVTKAIDEEFVKEALKFLLDLERGKSSMLNFFKMQLKMFSKMAEAHAMVVEAATNMITDQKLMKTIKESQYDMILSDPAWGTGILLAHHLQLPLVYNVRWITSGEGHFAIAPSPISYIPVTGSGLSDKMTFRERVKNMLFYILALYIDRFVIKPNYQAFCDQFFNPKVDFNDLVQTADLWLNRVDFVFEFPRPTMPNIIYMGGFQCKPAENLPEDLEEFVQSSGEHGVILMSLGSFVSELTNDLADEIAAAFAQLPQKVIWRYTGDRPTTLGNNTRLVSWMPQNDLLGHPKTRAAVLHGGTNGVQEAIYHGVPVLGFPLFFDQYDNLLRLKERGGTRILSLGTLDRHIFLQTLQEVLHDPSYRMNMQRLSRLHRDQPMKPLDRALFWIEFVMRNKGAAHLRTESYRMPWYSYHSVDIIGVLLAAVLLIILIIIAVIRYLCCRVCFKRKLKHE
ncbi:hypothetical protein AGOR_G00163700 [Albula goreensis]|uniref:UDP-glycosyltransferases domain-containing protein n=1 Tax=Albula goreensis TaxID=1534307 RepID=A0A8T3D4F9_9TELE|nr:hypothetical protein AGOR_G00163700 [Albula goreensis]